MAVSRTLYRAIWPYPGPCTGPYTSLDPIYRAIYLPGPYIQGPGSTQGGQVQPPGSVPRVDGGLEASFWTPTLVYATAGATAGGRAVYPEYIQGGAR